MDQVLDILWLKIVAGVHLAARGMDWALEPFAFLGPALMIFLLALFTVCATKFFGRIYTTKRYKELKKEFFSLVWAAAGGLEVERYGKGARSWPRTLIRPS